jgi:hypothetical protein
MPLTPPPPPPPLEDEASLFSLSSEFLEAALVLYDSLPTRIKFTMATYYLTGHSCELMLKSMLHMNGDTIDDLRKRYGHDLKLLIKRARFKGLPQTIGTEHMERFANAYTRKRTEYRQARQLHLPPLDSLLGEAKLLQAYVFSIISALK